MTILLNIFIITLIVCYVIDISGFVNEIKIKLMRWLHINKMISLKPFDCSLCMSHWINLIYVLYLLITGYITLQNSVYYYLWILFLSTNTINITSCLQMQIDATNKIINLLWKKI